MRPNEPSAPDPVRWVSFVRAIKQRGRWATGNAPPPPVLTDMKRFPRSLLIGVCLSLFGLLPQLQPVAAQPAAQWTTYRNASGTTVPFPADVFTLRGGEGTPRGEVFTTADGRARLHIFAFANDRNEGPAQFIKRVIVDDRRKLTYEPL